MFKSIFLKKHHILSYLKWENSWTILVWKVPIDQIICFSNVDLNEEIKILIPKQLQYQLLFLKNTLILDRVVPSEFFHALCQMAY